MFADMPCPDSYEMIASRYMGLDDKSISHQKHAFRDPLKDQS